MKTLLIISFLIVGNKAETLLDPESYPCGTFKHFNSSYFKNEPELFGVLSGVNYDGTNQYVGYGNGHNCNENPSAGFISTGTSLYGNRGAGAYLPCANGISFDNENAHYLFKHANLQWNPTDSAAMFYIEDVLKTNDQKFAWGRFRDQGQYRVGKIYWTASKAGLYIQYANNTEKCIKSGFEVLSCCADETTSTSSSSQAPETSPVAKSTTTRSTSSSTIISTLTEPFTTVSVTKTSTTRLPTSTSTQSSTPLITNPETTSFESSTNFPSTSIVKTSTTRLQTTSTSSSTSTPVPETTPLLTDPETSPVESSTNFPSTPIVKTSTTRLQTSSTSSSTSTELPVPITETTPMITDSETSPIVKTSTETPTIINETTRTNPETTSSNDHSTPMITDSETSPIVKTSTSTFDSTPLITNPETSSFESSTNFPSTPIVKTSTTRLQTTSISSSISTELPDPITKASSTKLPSTSTMSISSTSSNVQTTTKAQIDPAKYSCGTFLPYDPINAKNDPSTFGFQGGINFDGTPEYVGYGDNIECDQIPSSGFISTGSSLYGNRGAGAYLSCGSGISFDNQNAHYLVKNSKLSWAETDATGMFKLLNVLTVGEYLKLAFGRIFLEGQYRVGKLHFNKENAGLYVQYANNTEDCFKSGFEVLTCCNCGQEQTTKLPTTVKVF